jgi:hypothetical protein
VSDYVLAIRSALIDRAQKGIQPIGQGQQNHAEDAEDAEDTPR